MGIYLKLRLRGKKDSASCRVFLRDIHKSEPRHRQYGLAVLFPELALSILYDNFLCCPAEFWITFRMSG